jgi:hypothetical protein
LCQYGQAPAAYLRKLPPELASINLQWGLERDPMAVQAQMESITKGRPFDPIVGREQEQVDRYWTEWQAYTAKAIELHAREAQGESP